MVAVGVSVIVGVEVAVFVGVGVGVEVLVGVGVGVFVGVDVGVGVGVKVGVDVDVGVGVGATTCKSTVTVWGAFTTHGNGDVIVMGAVYRPAVRPVVSTDTFITEGAVPEEGLMSSQEMFSSVAIQVKPPAPVLLMFTSMGGGLGSPSVTVPKSRVVGLTSSIGCSYTVTLYVLFGVYSCCVLVMVTVATPS